MGVSQLSHLNRAWSLRNILFIKEAQKYSVYWLSEAIRKLAIWEEFFSGTLKKDFCVFYVF